VSVRARRVAGALAACTFALASAGAVALAAAAHRAHSPSPCRRHASARRHAGARTARAGGVRARTVCRSHRSHRSTPSALAGSPGGSATGGGGAANAPSQPPAPPGESPGGAPGGTGPAPPSVPHVLVTAVEWSFSLSRTKVPAGKVVLQFVDHGQDEHNLTLTARGEIAGALPNTHPEEMRQLTLDMSAGSYTLFCSLPEHEQRGMKATLAVE
jgi:plastocyanin